MRAFALARNSDWPQAEAEFEATMALGSPSAGTLLNLAVLRRRRGDDEGALPLLEQAAAQKPTMSRVFLERFNLLSAMGRHQEAKARADALPGDSVTARSTRAQARGWSLLDEAEAADARGANVEPMRSDAEVALTEALQGAQKGREPLIRLALVQCAFLQHRNHQQALDALLKPAGKPFRSGAAMHLAYQHAVHVAEPAIARSYLEQALELEPGRRPAARDLARLLLADELPDPVRALQVLSAAHRTAAAWQQARDLASRAVEACTAPEVIDGALPALATAAESGLFGTIAVPDCLRSSLQAISRNSRSLPPALTALLTR
jgi:tetratricopeptide (TPR) repeat protein